MLTTRSRTRRSATGFGLAAAACSIAVMSATSPTAHATADSAAGRTAFVTINEQPHPVWIQTAARPRDNGQAYAARILITLTRTEHATTGSKLVVAAPRAASDDSSTGLAWGSIGFGLLLLVIGALTLSWRTSQNR